MGTNYYAHLMTCPHCGKPDEVLHIGKSSCGWEFLFQGEQDASLQFTSASAWHEFLSGFPVCIVDENGRKVSPRKFWNMVEKKKGGLVDDSDRKDRQGYRFCDREFS